MYIIYYRYYCYYLIEEYSVASLHHHARPSDTPRARTEPTKVRVPTLVCHITCFLCLFSVCERVFCPFFLHAFSHRVSLYDAFVDIVVHIRSLVAPSALCINRNDRLPRKRLGTKDSKFYSICFV